MVDKALTADPSRRRTAGRAEIGALAAALAVAALGVAFAWSDPADLWPACLLIAALVINGVGRFATRVTRQHSNRALDAMPPVVMPSIVLPSIVLASDRAMVIAAFAFAAAALVWPDRFPVLASFFAGLMTMGGIARLVVARVVVTAARPEEGD